MTETTTPQTDEPGLLGRAIGVITSPGATFAHVVRDPRPVAILFVVALIIAVAQAIPQFTEAGRQAIIDTQVETIERFTGQPVDDETYQQMVEGATRGAYFSIVGTFIFLPLLALFFGGLYWGIFNALLGGTASFKQVLGVVTHSMVILAVGAAITAPIQLMTGDFDPRGPFNLGALGGAMDPDGFLATFLGWINILTIWQIFVIAIGLGVLYRRKSTGIAIGLLIAYGVVVAGVVSVVRSFTG